MPGMQGMRVSIDRGDKSPMTGDNHTLCFRCKVNSEDMTTDVIRESQFVNTYLVPFLLCMKNKYK